MNALEELMADSSRKSMSRFFLKIGRKAREPRFENRTEPLFGLPLILEAEGLLSRDLQYLAKCERAIAEAAREWRA